MFLNKLLEYNRPLVEFAQRAHARGDILPDTYLLDLDTIEKNAALLLEAGNKNNIKLYFMLKQIGRIPAVGKLLSEIGFAGAVCVDFREALTMLAHGIPLGNVGHLVQTPKAALEQIIRARPQIMTVYTLEKAAEISQIASKHNICQNIMLRVIDEGDDIYPGQHGGFYLSELEQTSRWLKELKGVRIAGVTNFPCILYNEKTERFASTHNATTVQKAAEWLHGEGYTDLQINMPSASCVDSMALIARLGGTHAEPGHSLTGTTPYHANKSHTPEQPALLYLSEISHTLGDKSYCYGGGYYRRGHLNQALIGNFDIEQSEPATLTKAYPPSAESIDYHIELEGVHSVSGTVIMCFRTQIFVTRSEVAVVRGLSCGKPEITGIYTSQGQLVRK